MVMKPKKSTSNSRPGASVVAQAAQWSDETENGPHLFRFTITPGIQNFFAIRRLTRTLSRRCVQAFSELRGRRVEIVMRTVPASDNGKSNGAA